MPRTARVARAGLVGGCSVAAAYYTYVTYDTYSRESATSRALEDDGSRGPAGIPGAAGPTTTKTMTTTITKITRPTASRGMDDLQHVKQGRKSMTQRMKDSMHRRRAQHKFPYNSWWKWRRRRVYEEREMGEGETRDRSKVVPSGVSFSTAAVAARFSHVVGDVKLVASRLMGEQDAVLAPRFDDLEIARYAIHYGLLRIDERDALNRDSEGYRMVVQDAAEGIVDSQAWFGRHVFASIQDIHKEEFADLIWWSCEGGDEGGQGGDDGWHRPVLHVDVGRAVVVCATKAKQKEFANIVLTMMELASLNSPLVGIEIPPTGIDRIDVAIYAKGTNTMNATSAFWILRSVVKVVSHHYPGRLNTLVLHDLPTFLNWVVLGVKRLVPRETADKFRVM